MYLKDLEDKIKRLVKKLNKLRKEETENKGKVL